LSTPQLKRYSDFKGEGVSQGGRQGGGGGKRSAMQTDAGRDVKHAADRLRDERFGHFSPVEGRVGVLRLC